MTYRDRFLELGYFLRAYFYIDWMIEYGSEGGAVRAYVNDLSPQEVHGAINELNQLIELNLKGTELDHVLCEDLGSGYYPDTDYKDMNDWLRFIRDTMAKYAAEKAKQEKAESAKSKQ